MKRTKWFVIILTLVVAGMISNVALAGTEHQFDKEAYVTLAKKNIGRIISGSIDPEAMISDMETLMDLGIQGSKEHMNEKETPQTEAKLLSIAIDSAGRMKSLTLEELESQWHDGGFLKSKGIDISGYDHFSEVMCHYDAIIHPATAIVCLRKYKETKSEDYLEQMKDELSEVVEHMKHLD
ncbi:hypothetical protein JXL19_12880 [bacterium]|nr:hypothetical protein [bacterium]